MSERSPPESSESRRTFLPDGRASISMPVFSGSDGSVSVSRPDATRKERGEQRVEVGRHVGERGLEDDDDLGIDRADHPGELAPAALHVVELGLEELVALEERLVLAQRERVDGPEQSQLAFELASPTRGRRSFGELG